jgi:hypothetical protein
MSDQAPVVVHSFDTCADAECLLCLHYRAGLAAGHDFMKSAPRGLARVRVAAGEPGGGQPGQS